MYLALLPPEQLVLFPFNRTQVAFGGAVDAVFFLRNILL